MIKNSVLSLNVEPCNHYTYICFVEPKDEDLVPYKSITEPFSV